VTDGLAIYRQAVGKCITARIALASASSDTAACNIQ
jgi:hypothetical protein